MSDDLPDRWHLDQDDGHHTIEIVKGAWQREVRWLRDGTEMVSRTTSDDTVVLAAPDDGPAVRLKFPMTGPARRVTLHATEVEAHGGLGGTDFDPEPGSKAAERAEWIGRHPHLHTARQTGLAVAGVAVPVLLLWLLSQAPWPDIDVPWFDIDLPSIPWPSIPWPEIPWPSIPWPSIPWPSISWPDLPELPPWVDTARKILVPVLIAFFIARGEIKRRRAAEQRATSRASVTGSDAGRGKRVGDEGSDEAQAPGEAGSQGPGPEGLGPDEPGR